MFFIMIFPDNFSCLNHKLNTMHKNSTFFICLLISSALYSQREYGIEYQHGFGRSYNSNSIGASFENFNNGKGSWHAVLHYTWDIFTTEKKTQGVSDLGFSLGYRYGFSYGDNGNFISGIRFTYSFITEKDHSKLTPSAELGYHYAFNGLYRRGSGFITPSFAFGYDFLVGKDKAEDFKGPLFIPRIVAGYRSYY